MNNSIYLFFKRVFDITFSIIVLLLLLVPLIVISITIKISSKGPILYKWEVVGENEIFFKVISFGPW